MILTAGGMTSPSNIRTTQPAGFQSQEYLAIWQPSRNYQPINQQANQLFEYNPLEDGLDICP